MEDRPPVDTVGQPVPANVRVEKRVSLNLRESANEPEAQHSARRECEDRGKDCAPAQGGHPPKSYKGLTIRALGLE